MRALVITFILVVATPLASLAQGDAAMAAARAATGSTVGTEPAAKKAAAPAPTPAPAPAPAKPASAKPAADKAADAPAAVVATPADAANSPALSAHGFTYNPEGRRDPFVNLLRRGTGVDQGALTGPRPSGLKGLGTGEVTLKGTLASQGAYVAILQGSDARTYVVHQGEKLFDGTVRSITADSLVILQQVNDPLSKETQREVRKVLRQTEEAK
jgi:Tfp pilus assembly protein PilP